MTWATKAISDNVHEIKFNDIAAGWEQYILLSSDRHHDNPHANHKLEKKHLDMARERNAPIVDNGDLFCAMQGRYDSRRSQTSLRPEHRTDDYFGALIDTAEEFYKPYADLFTVIGKGNHESSILKHNNIDLTKMLVKRLNDHTDNPVYSGGYGGYVILRFNAHKTRRSAIILKYYHGSGGGGAVTRGVIQTNRRSTYMPDANIIMTGHIHEAWIMTTPRERINRHGKLSLDTQWHISTPTYKEEYGQGAGGYHVESGRPPKPVGCAWLKFWIDGQGVVKWRVELDVL